MKKGKNDNWMTEISEWDQDWRNGEEEESGANMLREHVLEVVENQLRDGEPAFVTDVFYSLQKKGLCRKEARIVIAGVLLEEIYHTLKEPGGHDEKRYETNLRRQNRQIMGANQVPDVALLIEEDLEEACSEVWKAILENDEESAADRFTNLWPRIEEYVEHYMYRDTPSGVRKTSVEEILVATGYRLDFTNLIPNMGMVFHNMARYQEGVVFCREALELFRWDGRTADELKAEVGEMLAEMGGIGESDAWFEDWLKNDPGNGSCVNAYAFCYQLRGDLERARRIIESTKPVRRTDEPAYENYCLRAESVYRECGEIGLADQYKAVLKEIQAQREKEILWQKEMEPVQQPIRKMKKIYPNDPCSCGSGKKYKKCCGRK